MGAMGLLGNVMMGVGGKVIDYAMQEGRLLREERMRELDRNWKSDEAAKDRTFKSEEANTDRTFRSGESEKDREFRGGESEAERDLRMQLQGSSQAHSATEAEKSRAFQAEQADKTRSNGLLTKIEEDGSGRKYRVKADGSIEYLDVGSGIDKRKQLADKAARERADSVIGKDSGMQTPESRNETWQKVYDQEMGRQGYGSKVDAGADKAETAKPVVGDTPPKGEVSPGAGAVWSERVGGWVADGGKDKDGKTIWRKVVVNKPAAAAQGEQNSAPASETPASSGLLNSQQDQTPPQEAPQAPVRDKPVARSGSENPVADAIKAARSGQQQPPDWRNMTSAQKMEWATTYRAESEKIQQEVLAEERAAAASRRSSSSSFLPPSKLSLRQ